MSAVIQSSICTEWSGVGGGGTGVGIRYSSVEPVVGLGTVFVPHLYVY